MAACKETLINFKNDICVADKVPIEIWEKIFLHLDITSRIKASWVSRRWRNVLLSSGCASDDVAVFNIFERSVWENNIKSQSSLRVSTLFVDDISGLSHMAELISSANSVKFWYGTEVFAKEAVDAVVSVALKIKSVDLYPYCQSIITDHVYEKIPSIENMTIRPNHPDYFWTGLEMKSMPSFENLTNLCVDSISFTEDVVLPPNLQMLEFQNRCQSKYLILLKKLKDLKKLAYLTISHADMTKPGDFFTFLDAIQSSKIPMLEFLAVRFCKFPTASKSYFLTEDQMKEMKLQFFKIDLCYGDVTTLAKTFFELNPKMNRFAIQIIEDKDSLKSVRELSFLAKKHKIWMQFGVMQRETKRAYSFEPPPITEEDLPILPSEFFDVASRFEGSFMWRSELLDEILKGAISHIQEIKLINCDAVNDSHLEGIAKNGTMLRRISIINCRETTDKGMRKFIEYFDSRKTFKLTVIWKRGNKSQLSGFSLSLGDFPEISKGKSRKFTTKTFTDDTEGQRVTVWEKGTKKELFIQDFSEPDGHQLIGIVVGRSQRDNTSDHCDDEPPSVPPPPPPDDPAKLLKKLTLSTSV